MKRSEYREYSFRGRCHNRFRNAVMSACCGYSQPIKERLKAVAGAVNILIKTSNSHLQEATNFFPDQLAHSILTIKSKHFIFPLYK